MKQRIAVLGAGRMGGALSAAFLRAGHEVTVWNRTVSKCAPLAAAGARVASSVAEAIQGAELVIGNVSDYPVTEALLGEEEARGLRNAVFVQLATGTPRQAKDAAAWAERRGIRYLDGAIMATPDFIGQPGCLIIYSGPAGLFEAVQPALVALGGNALHVGSDIGHANALDNAILVVLWGALQGVLQGAAICEAERFPLGNFKTSLQAAMPVLEGALAVTLDRIEKRRFAADQATLATVDICHASVRHVLEISRQHGVDLGLPQALDRVYQRAHDAGHGQDDLAAIYQVMR